MSQYLVSYRDCYGVSGFAKPTLILIFFYLSFYRRFTQIKKITNRFCVGCTKKPLLELKEVVLYEIIT